MSRIARSLACIALAAGVTGAHAREGCSAADPWLEDPGISLAVLRANGYRLVSSHAQPLDRGRLAVERIAVRGDREARCRTVYTSDGEAVARTCFLPCRTP